jgi:hypothetical protein
MNLLTETVHVTALVERAVGQWLQVRLESLEDVELLLFVGHDLRLQLCVRPAYS